MTWNNNFDNILIAMAIAWRLLNMAVAGCAHSNGSDDQKQPLVVNERGRQGSITLSNKDKLTSSAN